MTVQSSADIPIEPLIAGGMGEGYEGVQFGLLVNR